MSFRSRDSTCYLEVACIHCHACDRESTQPCVIDACAMLAQLLIRRISSKQVAIAASAFWRCTTSTSKCCSRPPVKDTSSRASRTTQELHTFAYKFQPTMGLTMRIEISPLMKGYVSPVSGKGFSHGKLSEFTAIRSLWGQGLSQKGNIKLGRLGVGNLRMKLHKKDTVRGISTSNDYGLSSQVPMWGLIVLNFAVYAMWQTQERHSMIRNWMVSVDSVIRGRFHTLLTYSVSNNRLDHLIEDMLGLYFFGGEIARRCGAYYMLRCYLVGAIAGSVGHLAFCTIMGEPYDDFNYTMTPYVMGVRIDFLVAPLDLEILLFKFVRERCKGASAATNALVVNHVLLYPHHIILANYVLPVPGIVFGAYLVLADVYDVYEEGTRTTHAGAVAGALSGVRLWWKIKRSKLRRSRKPRG